MVRLDNIKMCGSMISCDYFPEDTDYKGFLQIDSKGNIIRLDYSDYEYGKKTYVSFAKRKLKELMTSGKEIPVKSEVAWY